MTPLFRAVLAALFFWSGLGYFPAHAKDGESLRWLTPAQEQALVDALPPAPSPGSPTDRSDLATILKVQAERTPAQAAQMLTEKGAHLFLFQTVLGPDFNSKHEPKIYLLLQQADYEARVIDRDAKARWKRLRPFQAHPEVHPVYEAEGMSYPSGHATFAYVSAVLLSEIFPDKKAALLAEAAEIAQNRVIGGVHYPSDITEGQQLGRSVAQALLANPTFRQSLAGAKAEAVGK